MRIDDVLLHENVELPEPTLGALFADEAPLDLGVAVQAFRALLQQPDVRQQLERLGFRLSQD